MNSLIMLKMALMQLKEYSTNKWVIIDNKKYNIDTALSLIKVAEEDFTNWESRLILKSSYMMNSVFAVAVTTQVTQIIYRDY